MDAIELFHQWLNEESNPLRNMNDADHPMPIVFQAGYDTALKAAAEQGPVAVLRQSASGALWTDLMMPYDYAKAFVNRPLFTNPSISPQGNATWEPIATAPKDGKAVILLMGDGKVLHARWLHLDDYDPCWVGSVCGLLYSEDEWQFSGWTRFDASAMLKLSLDMEEGAAPKNDSGRAYRALQLMRNPHKNSQEAHIWDMAIVDALRAVRAAEVEAKLAEGKAK